MLPYENCLRKLAARAFDKFMSGSNDSYHFDIDLLAEIYGVDSNLFYANFEAAYRKVSNEHYAKYSSGVL